MSENKVCYGVDMSVEEWRTKPEWEGYYEFSNWGGARSLDRLINGKGGTQRLRKGRDLTIHPQGTIVITINKQRNEIPLRNIIAGLFIPDYEEGMPIIMIDGDKRNCSLANIKISPTFSSLAPSSTSKRYQTLKLLEQTIQGIPVIEGGFGEGQRVLLDKTIANGIGVTIGNLKCANIAPNLQNMEEGVDYIDLIQCSNINEYIPILLKMGYNSKGLLLTQHIYIFSERGVAKLMATLQNNNPRKWEWLNKFVDEYFNMREQIKNQVPQLTEKQLCILALYEGGAEAVTAGKRLSEIEVQEATAPLIETIEEQKPKVAKYQEYVDSDGYIAPRQAAQILKLPHATAQAFNKLLKEHGIQYKSGKNWVLYEKYNWMLEKDYCKQVPYIDSNGTSHHNLRWTPKGLNYIRDNILNNP